MTTLLLIGDSTVRNGSGQGGNGQWGWGDCLQPYFDPRRLTVQNRARGGRSSRTFLTEGLWDEARAMLKPGDFVLMQFGHNDGGPLVDASRARGSLKGIGKEAKEIENPILKRHETVHTYGWYLEKYISDTLGAQATPFVCTPIPRKIFEGAKIPRTDAYARWAREVANSQETYLLDIAETIAQHYDELGRERVEPLFADEHTHTTRAGAELNAQCVADTIRALVPNPLREYLL